MNLFVLFSGLFGDLLNAGGANAGASGVAGVLAKIESVTEEIKNIVMYSCALLMLIVVIWIGFRLATADDSRRQDAKMHLMYAIFGLLIAVSMVTILDIVIPQLKAGLTKAPAAGTLPGSTEIQDAIKNTTQTVLNIVTTLGALFALFVAWQFLKADTADKRANAKKQLIWSLVAAVGCILLSVAAAAVFTQLEAEKPK
jgi:NADH:ubiquinone oxidoreductase subunit 6 (subunit J)